MNDKRLLVLLLFSCFGLMGCQSQIKKAVRAETVDSEVVQEKTTQEVKHSTVHSALANSQTHKSSVMEETSSKEESTKISEASESVSTESSEVVTTESIAPVEILQPPITSEKVEKNYQFSVVKNQTTEEFIQLIGSDAQQIAWNNGLYASVMIAQAILETGSGNSQLARPPYHNLFGIKGSYQGKNVTFNTQEDIGNGQLYTIQSAFRQYPSYRESLEDYASLLKNGLSGNPQFYQGTWKDNAATYEEATKALTGKYATDTSYDKKLNALIEAYELMIFDQESKQEVEQPVLQEDYHFEATTESKEKAETAAESKDSKEESRVLMIETKQPVVRVSPITQRPAKQVTGKQIVE